MLLAKLKEYSDRQPGDKLPSLYASTPVAYIVELGASGIPLSKQPTSQVDPSTTRGKRGLDIPAPEVNRTYNVKPLLLADNGEYTFGRARDPKKQARTDQCHKAYLDLIRKCATETREPSVLAVQRFYEQGGADLLELGDDWNYGLKATFRVHLGGGPCIPINLLSVQEFWASTNTPDPGSVETGQCLVCGETKPVLDRLQAKVKGIPGGQTAGTSIISANSAAFESYGMTASRVAPTCSECAEGFTRGINELLTNRDTRLFIGGAVFAFWTAEQVGFNFGAYLQNPDSADVAALIDSFRTGRRAADVDKSAFHAVALTASGGRAVVREWIDTTVGNAADSMARWFQLQRIVHPRDEDPTGTRPDPMSIFQLAISTVRDRNDMPPTTPRALFRSALVGTPLPMDIAFQAVRRCRAEQGITRPRAALIKLVLLSRDAEQPQEDYMVALEPQHPETAYHCGRLLAVLEAVQRRAVPGVNATIVDRFYGAASSTPAIVFGSLLRGAQPHLSKLDRPARSALQNRVAEVCGQIDGFPKTLSLERQALFSLGYYHQKAHDRAQAISHRAARDAGHTKPETTETPQEDHP